MKLTTNDKLVAVFLAIGQLSSMYLNNNVGLLMSNTSAIIYIAYRIWQVIEVLSSNLDQHITNQTEVAKVIIPEPTPAMKHSDCYIESIPKVLSGIYYSEGKTVFDHIVEVSTTETVSINLMKAHDAIIESLSELKYNTNVK